MFTNKDTQTDNLNSITYNVTSNECVAGNGQILERIDTSEFIKEQYKGLVSYGKTTHLLFLQKYVLSLLYNIFGPHTILEFGLTEWLNNKEKYQQGINSKKSYW